MKKWAFLLVFLAWPAHAAHFKNGNDLFSLCDSQDLDEKRLCLNYILGASDATHEVSRAAGGSGLCYPDSVNAGQVVDVVVKYLREKPAVRHTSAAQLVILAITDAFPCPSK